MPKPKVDARPTKRFFVSMLTRDIDLRDAILDLLDNCIDGVVRSIRASGDAKGSTDKGNDKPYSGFEAKINATTKGFELHDNCGGIPRDVAIHKAFRLGRPESQDEEKIETVGVYGIGMKRAIFKIGKQATVFSQHKDDAFEVNIDNDWLHADDDWELPIEDAKAQKINGTSIVVKDLYEPISQQFDTKQSTFLADLVKLIGQLYAVIIAKGFKVSVNGQAVEPVEVKLLVSGVGGKGEVGINPYIFKGRQKGVEVEIVVGFYRPLASESEVEEALDLPQATRERAGWSVICNDRLVLHADKTPVTGWGVGSVPNYHGQFISIAGVATFRSTDPSLLPLNTTKRGLDTSSDLYFFALNYMMEGLKLFTDFTNKWKTKEKESDNAFEEATPIDPVGVPAALPDTAYRKVPDNKIGPSGEGKVFKPNLPKPETPEKTHERIAYTRSIREIKIVSRYLFDDENKEPGEVGAESFDYVAREAKRK